MRNSGRVEWRQSGGTRSKEAEDNSGIEWKGGSEEGRNSGIVEWRQSDGTRSNEAEELERQFWNRIVIKGEGEGRQ